MKYIFGPVPSRRLGMSLGVDVVPFKTCTFDCIYCQLGITTSKSIQRCDFVPAEEVLTELRKVLDDGSGRVDFITFSGSGEPTLNSQLGDMIRSIKTFTRVPVAVLTNGSLLYRDDVRRDLREADLVVPSLDAIKDGILSEINRPHESITAELVIEGLKKFSQEFTGKIWLEIMLVRGVNDQPEELKQMADLIRGLKVDKIHLNTVVRPPAEDSALAVTAEEMRRILSIFDHRAEVVVDFDRLIESGEYGVDREGEVMALLERRPCTVGDISSSLGIHRNEVIKYVNHLTGNGFIRRVKHADKWYYEQIPEGRNIAQVISQPQK